MADVITETRELKIELGFADGDTRTITLPNPVTTITEETLKQVATDVKNLFIGDKAGAAFTAFNKVERVTKQTTTLDLTTG